MDITHVNVHEQPTLPAAVQLLKASTSEVTSNKHVEDCVERVEDQEEIGEVMVVGEPISRVSMWCMMPMDTNIRSITVVISSLDFDP